MSISHHKYMIDIHNICIWPLSYIINMLKCHWKECDLRIDSSSVSDPVPLAGQQVLPGIEFWQIILTLTNNVISQFNLHPWTMIFRKTSWRNCHTNRYQNERIKIKLQKSGIFQVKEWMHLASCDIIEAKKLCDTP